MEEQDLSKLRIERKPGGARPVSKGRRRLLPALLAAAAVAAAAWAIHFNSAVPVEPSAVTVAYPSQAHALLNATGYVVAQRKAAVASKATGRLEWLGVAEGSRVKKGDVIARLESRDVAAARDQAAANVEVARAGLQQALAELTDAEAALARSNELVAKKFVSRSAHDAALARFEKARAGVGAARASIAAAEANHRAAAVAVDHTLVRAPFDGVVLTKSANVGDVVTPFSSALDAKGAVVTMADMDTLEVEADVSESNLQKVRLGQPCEIQLDALPEVRLRGSVHRVVPTVDRAKATVLVKVKFLDEDPRVLPEMSAKVAFLSREMPPEERGARTVVRPEAVAKRGGRTVVFVIHDGTVAEVAVEPGDRIGDLVEIRKGVQAGERVVLKPSAKLADGSRVTLPQK